MGAATTDAVRPSDLILEANTLEAKQSRTPEEEKRLATLKETIDSLVAAEAATLSTPAEQLAGAEEPDRPDGAADDEPWEYEQTEGRQPQEPAEAEAPASPDLEPLENLDTAQLIAICENDAATFADAGAYEVPAAWELLSQLAGADDSEAREYVNSRIHDAQEAGLTDAEAGAVEPAGEEVSGELFPVPTTYDEKLYAELIGGRQPDEKRIAIKGLPSLTLENAPERLRKGDVLEARVQLRVTGRADTDKLKHNLETEELELTSTTEKITLTVTAAAVVDD